MGDYFKPWRRKFGVVTLVLACACVGLWVRSLVTIDRYSIHAGRYDFNHIASLDGSVVWQRGVPVDVSKWSTEINEFAPELFHGIVEGVAEYLLGSILGHDDVIEWKHQLCGFEIGEFRSENPLGVVQMTIWKLSYWWLIAPLTLISANLIFSRPQKSKSKTITESSPQTAA